MEGVMASREKSITNRLAAMAALLWPFLLEHVVFGSVGYTVFGVVTVFISWLGIFMMGQLRVRSITSVSFNVQFLLSLAIIVAAFFLEGQLILLFFSLSWLLFGSIFITGLWAAKTLWSPVH
jgi:hypothetical protein